MSEKETAGAYTRQKHNPYSRSFARWLVVLDVMPNVGNIDGFSQIALPRRTLNVAEKKSLPDALLLIRDSARELRNLVKMATMQSSFRFSFSLIDLSAQFAVTTDKILEWSKFETMYVPDSASESRMRTERMKAGNIARTLHGKEAPSPVLLDATDPIDILRRKGLMPIWDAVPEDIPPAGLGIYDDSISVEEYDKAIKQAKKLGKTAWIEGLVTLPDLIEDSIQRQIAKKVDSIIDGLIRQGLPDTSPRLAIVPSVLERSLSTVRQLLASDIFRTIVVEFVDYSNPQELDLVVLSRLKVHIFDSLPDYMTNVSNSAKELSPV